jgi:hypothetical protein
MQCSTIFGQKAAQPPSSLRYGWRPGSRPSPYRICMRGVEPECRCPAAHLGLELEDQAAEHVD